MSELLRDGWAHDHIRIHGCYRCVLSDGDAENALTAIELRRELADRDAKLAAAQKFRDGVQALFDGEVAARTECAGRAARGEDCGCSTKDCYEHGNWHNCTCSPLDAMVPLAMEYDAALSLSIPTSPQTEPLLATNSQHRDHPYFDPGDGRTECETCGKWVWMVTHSCKGVPVTVAALKRLESRRSPSTSPTEDDPPTFNQLLSDPTEQFDRRSELLPHVLTYLGVAEPDDRAAALMRSIEEYRHAPSNTASAPRYVPPSPTEDEQQRSKCICDGGAYMDKMPRDWRPFVVNVQCVVHGATSPEQDKQR